ncbi:hypothetical protein [Streptomyces sp. AC550_RSS872]|uniref:hypothetical protein n=1 Tax=Streptomyces sp. AC550_RSS872 TaxID=2823689 RepID=UPI001C27F9FB|nr:hypothetical protein [Streptomyces sp. AC550_RSS872]
MVTSPKIIGTGRITACLPYGTKVQLEQLRPFFTAEAARANALAPIKGTNRQVASSRRSRWKQEKQRLRRADELTDTLIALVTGGLVREIAERAWPEKLTVDLPADSSYRPRRMLEHVQEQHQSAVQVARALPRSPAPLPHCPTRPGCSAEALAEYAKLASDIITPGVIWRAAVARGILTAEARQNPVLISSQPTAPGQRTSTAHPAVSVQIPTSGAWGRP